MDAVKVLGKLLGNKRMATRAGKRVLGEILSPGRRGIGSNRPFGGMVAGAARRNPSLAGYGAGGLGGSLGRRMPGRSNTGRRTNVRQGYQSHLHGGLPAGRRGGYGAGYGTGFGGGMCPSDQQATIMIRAMISAVKADGLVDNAEHANIIRQLGHITPQEQQFLQHEFAQPINVAALAASVPPGLAEDVYTVSLMAIDLDTQNEARYLQDLARALGLHGGTCNRLHQHFGMRQLF